MIKQPKEQRKKRGERERERRNARRFTRFLDRHFETKSLSEGRQGTRASDASRRSSHKTKFCGKDERLLGPQSPSPLLEEGPSWSRQFDPSDIVD